MFISEDIPVYKSLTSPSKVTSTPKLTELPLELPSASTDVTFPSYSLLSALTTTSTLWPTETFVISLSSTDVSILNKLVSAILNAELLLSTLSPSDTDILVIFPSNGASITLPFSSKIISSPSDTSSLACT